MHFVPEAFLGGGSPEGRARAEKRACVREFHCHCVQNTYIYDPLDGPGMF